MLEKAGEVEVWKLKVVGIYKVKQNEEVVDIFEDTDTFHVSSYSLSRIYKYFKACWLHYSGTAVLIGKIIEPAGMVIQEIVNKFSVIRL